MEERKLILVDVQDRPLGTGKKREIHERGLLHRAFSLFLLDSQGQLLLQQRAVGKYHSGGLWTNSCCSHPAPGADLAEFIALRAREELGTEVTELRELGRFVYYADFGTVKEFEFDHVWVGRTRDAVRPDPEEILDCRWVDPAWAAEDLRLHPARYTAWYPMAFAAALPGFSPMK